MNKTERLESQRELWNIYCGILFHLGKWAEGEALSFTYRFDCPEYAELLARYPVEKTAGKGSGFVRALRLCRWLHPRLRHQGDYDNHIPCNSLALLGYCFEKEDVGINCVNKAKILAECCLALGIPARRVYAYPLSPYDMDNHVMTEVYDTSLKKWMLLDPTTGAYFADGAGVPLSAAEVRAGMAAYRPVTAVLRGQSVKEIKALFMRNLAGGENAYYAKNMAYLMADRVNTFGEAEGGAALLAPEGLDVKARTLENIRYRLNVAQEMGFGHMVPLFEKWQERARKNPEAPRISERAFSAPPETGVSS